MKEKDLVYQVYQYLSVFTVIHNIDDVSETYKRTKTPQEKERNKERKKIILFKHLGFKANTAYEVE